MCALHFFRLASLLKSPAVVETLAVVLRMTNFTSSSAAARAVTCRGGFGAAQRASPRPCMKHLPPCATAGAAIGGLHCFQVNRAASASGRAHGINRQESCASCWTAPCLHRLHMALQHARVGGGTCAMRCRVLPCLQLDITYSAMHACAFMPCSMPQLAEPSPCTLP